MARGKLAALAALRCSGCHRAWAPMGPPQPDHSHLHWHLYVYTQYICLLSAFLCNYVTCTCTVFTEHWPALAHCMRIAIVCLGLQHCVLQALDVSVTFWTMASGWMLGDISPKGGAPWLAGYGASCWSVGALRRCMHRCCAAATGTRAIIMHGRFPSCHTRSSAPPMLRCRLEVAQPCTRCMRAAR